MALNQQGARQTGRAASAVSAADFIQASSHAAKANKLGCTLEAASYYPDDRVCAHTDD